MSRRSSRARGTAPVFPALPEGIQNGLRRLVEDNADTVAQMLDVKDSSPDVLCEKCAQVMKQQQLSAASFLARFFGDDVLSEHAILLGKSGKGSAATLGDRIGAAWAQNKAMPEKEERGKDEEETKKGEKKNGDENEGDNRKRKSKEDDDSPIKIPKTKKK